MRLLKISFLFLFLVSISNAGHSTLLNNWAKECAIEKISKYLAVKNDTAFKYLNALDENGHTTLYWAKLGAVNNMHNNQAWNALIKLLEANGAKMTAEEMEEINNLEAETASNPSTVLTPQKLKGHKPTSPLGLHTIEEETNEENESDHEEAGTAAGMHDDDTDQEPPAPGAGASLGTDIWRGLDPSFWGSATLHF